MQSAEKPEPLASAGEVAWSPQEGWRLGTMTLTPDFPIIPGPQAPVLRRCELPVPLHRRPVQAWVESLRGYEQERVGLTELHPDVFSTAPRSVAAEMVNWVAEGRGSGV